jgi:hypothetical protein
MKQILIYRFHTKIEGLLLYTLNKNEKHPYMKNEFPSPIKMTKKNIINYLLGVQEEPIYSVTDLNKKKKEELLKMI